MHIAPLDENHKLTGRLTGYGKTIDIKLSSHEDQLFNTTKSHQHHADSLHPYDTESSTFQDSKCLYKGKLMSTFLKQLFMVLHRTATF